MGNSRLSFLFREVSASSLGMLRILLGIFILEDFYSLGNYISNDLIHSKFFFKYDGFHWISMLPAPAMHLVVAVCMFSTLLFALGIYYRANAIIVGLGFTYIFLLDRGHYNNHFYLYCILLGFFCLVDGNKWGAVSRNQSSNTVPYWQIFIFRAQLFIVYFYGAIAKIQGDWLSGFPMRFWLYDRSLSAPTFLQPLMQSPAGAYIFSYTGLLFDLLVGFMLFSARWRWFALIPIAVFHASNHFLWDIGTFPFVMMAATTIFFSPDWGEKAVAHFKQKHWIQSVLLIVSLAGFVSALFWEHNWIFFIPLSSLLILLLLGGYTKTFFKSFIPYRKPVNMAISQSPMRKPVLWFMGVWFAFQLIFPFRLWLYPGDPSWTGEGHLFAWRMMLVDTEVAFRVKAKIPETGEEFPIALNKYITYRQFRKSSRTPKQFLSLAHFLRDELVKHGAKDPIIKMEIWKSINERSPRLLNDTSLNYSEVPYTAVEHCSWMLPWHESDEPPQFNMDKYTHWKKFASEQNALKQDWQ